MNEALFGWQSSPNDFFGNSSPDMFTNQDGYFLDFGFPVSPNDSTITNPAPGNSNNPQPRNTPNFNIDNNLNWLKGNHSFKFGGSFTRISNRITNWTTVQHDQPRVQHDERSGRGTVQHDQLPGRVDQRPQQRAVALRACSPAACRRSAAPAG